MDDIRRAGKVEPIARGAGVGAQHPFDGARSLSTAAPPTVVPQMDVHSLGEGLIGFQ
jgi:hypothetical protein